MKLIFLFCFSLVVMSASSQSLQYPYPVHFISLNIENKTVRMAYMDVAAHNPNGAAVMLFHGKNFNGYYWKDVISFLSDAGYRVIVPDQVGWGQSDKPDIHYSFHLLSANTKALLHSLGISKVHLIGHSMGGMLATRFVLMYPNMVDKLVYENPIGLEDYRTFVPWHSLDVQYNSELKANYASLKKYQQSYFPAWKPEYEQYVEAQAAALQLPDFKSATWASALTYQMIYEQPVVYEFSKVKQQTLIIIGQADHTIVGKNALDSQTAAVHGQYPALGKKLHAQIKHSTLIPLEGVGHIPHIQVPALFRQHVLKFLKGS
jgi:pimeloyl-ACP methyl ester carboxylesterase